MTEGRRHLPGPPHRNPSSRNPASWNPGNRGSGGWDPFGEAHLALDAIVAYVDDELSPGARSRAIEHLGRCRDCVREVSAQLQARSALRSATAPTLPVSLLNTLRSIPQEAELPPPPNGLAVGPDGTFFSVLRPVTPGPTAADPGRQPPAWVRLGASAVAGLALGALIAGAMPFHEEPLSAGSTSEGPGVLDARLQLGPARPAAPIGEPVDAVQLQRDPGIIPTTPPTTLPTTPPPSPR